MNERLTIQDLTDLLAAKHSIESISLNGKSLETPFFNHQDIVNGGRMEIRMTDKPNYKTHIP